MDNFGRDMGRFVTCLTVAAVVLALVALGLGVALAVVLHARR